MPPRPKDLPWEFERWFGSRLFSGDSFFDQHLEHKENLAEAKEVAEIMRDHGLPARVVVLPRTGGVGGYDERVLLYTPLDNVL